MPPEPPDSSGAVRGACDTARHECRGSGLLARLGVTLAIVLMIAGVAGAAERVSLARFVPSRVGFFVELNNLRQARRTWQLDKLWNSVAGLAGAQTRGPGPLDLWRGQLERALGMSADEALDVLLGDQVAVAAPTYGALSAGVLIARVSNPGRIDELVARQRVVEDKPVARVRRYRTGNRVWLARIDDIVVVSTGFRGTALLEDVARLLAGVSGDPLADSEVYKSEVRALPPGFQGLVYFDERPSQSTSRPTTRPTVTIPPWPQLERGVIGLIARDGGLDAELRGAMAVPSPLREVESVSAETLTHLPADTLLAYATSLDYLAEVRRIHAGEHPQLGLYLALFLALSGQSEPDNKVIESLGPQTVVVVGQSRPGETEKPSYIRPMMSVMVQVKDPAPVAETVHQSVIGFVAVLNVQSLGGNRRANLRVERIKHGPDTLHHVDLRQFLPPLTRCVYFHTLDPCWTVSDRWLIVSTHPEHVMQILDARRRPQLEEGARSPLRPATERAFVGGGGEQVSSVLVSQSALSAGVVQSWLDYFARNHPQMFEPNWWQAMLHRREGDRVTLGVGLSPVTDHPGKLDVTKVLPGWPADGKLRTGDRIVGVDGRLLAADDPRADFNLAVRVRKHRDRVRLRIERDGRSRNVNIPLPPDRPRPADFDPIRTLRNLTALAEQFSSGSYTVWRSEPHRFNARVTLTLAPPAATSAD